MSTNPLGCGTKNISCNVPEEFKVALERLAAASGMTLSQYVRQVLSRAVEHGTCYHLQESAEPPPAPRPSQTPVTYRKTKN